MAQRGYNILLKRADPGARLPGFKFRLHHPLAVGPLTSYLAYDSVSSSVKGGNNSTCLLLVGSL